MSRKHAFKKRRKSKKRIKTIVHWSFALALLPLMWASGKALVTLMPSVASQGYKAWWLYLAGAAFYWIVAQFVHKPMWFYVWGHELTHAISGLLSGAKIHSIKAGSKGGEVRLSKSNAFVALSPYIFPFYAILTILIYAVVRRFWPDPYLTYGFQFLLGASLAFHLVLTWEAVHKNQPDLKVLGLFLSTVVIALGNTLILGVLTISLFKNTPSMSHYFKDVSKETLTLWKKGIVVTHGSINTLIDWWSVRQNR